MAKAKARKAPKKRRTAKQKAAALKNLKKARAARKTKSGGKRKAAKKTTKRKTAKRKVAKKATKKRVAKKTTRKTKRSHASYVRAGKKGARKRKAAKKSPARKASRKTSKRKGRKMSPSAKAAFKARMAAARARKRGGSRKSTAALFASNRRRRGGYRRNGSSLVGSIKPYLTLGALAVGGFAAHRMLSKPIASLASSVLSPTWGNVAASLLTAALGLYAVEKVSFLRKFGVGLKTGMLVSAGTSVVKNVLPDFANTIGIGGLESVSIGPRYSMGGFKQAMAGDPILQAAAGEYYSQGTGEYMSSDLYKAGPMGEYQMRSLDVLGDTGSYELQSMYGVGATPTYDGVRPESADTFLEAMAGVEDRSTYIPHEGESAITGGESSFDAGIFDAGNVLSG